MPAETAQSAVIAALTQRFPGQIRSDRLARALYATDASIYEITPDAVFFPRSVEDVCAAVAICSEHGMPVTPRGAGTGLTGGAVNRGVQMDLARHMGQIGELDVEARTVKVGPGVVLDELNAYLAQHGLYFAPDVATSSRATIGGMIGNNSCGAHSVYVGRTVNHIKQVELVLSDASTVRWGEGLALNGNSFANECVETIRRVGQDLADEIKRRWPTVMRRNGGYALDRLQLSNGQINPDTIMVGSEGTLSITTGATLNLLPLPKHKGLVVAHFKDMLSSLAAVPAILAHQPAAIELVDKLILDATLMNPAMLRRRWFIDGDPAAILIIELYDEDAADLERRLNDLAGDLKRQSLGYAWPIISDPSGQADPWEVRKSGLGLLMSIPGDDQPYAFVEDTAVEPDRLHDYIKRFGEIMAEEGVQQAGYYAHASVGCLHVRPVLNLKRDQDVKRMRRVADRISSLALDYGGTMTGEHGDGLVRSEWLAKIYGPRIIDGFRAIKAAFDPQNLLNPGKIVDPLPMDENLRYGADFQSSEPLTILNFEKHGGMAGLAGMCSGVGQCRQRLVGTMCPSYQATGDERDTTRARANALREALSNRDLLDGLSDPALDEVFDLCLSCKACMTECPTGTDIAKLKAEWQHHKHEREGVPPRTNLIAKTIEMAAWGSRFAPLSNWIAQNPIVRTMLDHWFGMDKRVPPPKFAGETFRQWFRKREPQKGTQGEVVYFVDTWTNYYTPQVGKAAVKVLEALGFEVIVADTACCGRPLISKGLLDDAKDLAIANVATLAPYAQKGIPIVGTEPSCVSVLLDELKDLCRDQRAAIIATQAKSIETFVAEELGKRPDALTFKDGGSPLLYHGHCHQKAMIGTGDAVTILGRCTHGQANEINSGCCGMAGSFGHEKEHYDVAKAVGEQRLFPAVRERGEAEIAISGFSCRHQIEHHCEVTPKHAIEVLAERLVSDEYRCGE